MAVINHGTVRGYKLGCRCEECTEANRKAKQRERDRRRERDGKPAARTPRFENVPTAPAKGPIEEGPGAIERTARLALAADPGEEPNPIAEMRREVVYAAARVMDNPKFAPFFKSAADVLRITVEDLLAGAPAKDGGTDALKQLMGSFGPRGRSRSRAAVDDTEASG